MIVVQAPLQLPFAPKPLRRELFSSWLLRLAVANCVTLDELLTGFQASYPSAPYALSLDVTIDDGLSKLSLGWMKLGIVHERIQPGRPQQNGRHERMHRTLKEDTAKPPARTVTAQQKKFDRFRLVFNHERPHEALANETPGSIYVPSTRLLPSSVASFQYPRSFQTRRVNNSGDISWHKGRVFVSEVFRNEEIGLEQMDEDVHRVFFCNTELGEFNSSEMRFRPALRA
jgi:hypothetical protein